MMFNQLKTIILLGTLSGIILLFGNVIGGSSGITIALGIALCMNFGMYFFSHKLVLAMYRAVPMSKKEYPQVHNIVEEIAQKMNLPKPKLYIVPTQTPNAFATGPTPKKAVVACTQGILNLLSQDELKGVLAHELSHVKNRDVLITTIAATLATLISYAASISRFAALTSDRDSKNGFSLLVLGVLSPIIALIVQLSISRAREYLADESGAKEIHDSKSLAGALRKIEAACRVRPLQGNATMSSLFFTNPFTVQGLSGLFSTHPPTSERIKRLEQLKM